MCGRFVGYTLTEQLQGYLPIDQVRCAVTANYNVAPTQQIPVVFRDGAANVLDTFHWGLVPGWAKDKSIGNRMINARVETVATKPSFHAAFKKRRCLIPANGFFEWQGPKGQKQPVYITSPGDRPLAFAGVWETWHEDYRSFAIITCPASNALKAIHDRMPAVLDPAVYEMWLDTDRHDAHDALAILKERTQTDFVFWPVSKQVNSVKINDPSNIEPIH